MRVVSLLPSATELLCAAGGRGLLVGRSHECDHPADLRDVPILTAARTDPRQDAAAIDAQVRAMAGAGEALYTLDAERLGALRPDLILTQDLCHVCSIDLGAVQRTAADFRRRGLCDPAILSLNPGTMEDVLDDLIRVGDAAGLATGAVRAAAGLRERLHNAQSLVNPYDDGPVVAFLEWTDPPFIAGHWTVQLIERAGGRHPLNPTVAAEGFGSAAGLQQGSRRAGHSIAVAPAALAATMPRWLVVCPCGLGLDAAWEATGALARQGWFADLPAVRAGRVAVVDGNQMFNRPGPRLVDAFEWLVSLLQGCPDLCPPGFPWRPWSGGGGGV